MRRSQRRLCAKPPVEFYLPPALIEAVKVAAAREGRTQSGYVQLALETALGWVEEERSRES